MRTTRHRGPSPLHGLWLRTQETPLELAVAVVAALIAALTLATQWAALSVYAVALFVCLAIGGLTTTAGRVTDGPHVESVGLVLMLAAYLFLVLRSLGQVHGLAALLGVTFNAAALAFGFGVRLVVVRKAVAARKWGARRSANG